jgi:nucleoside phosphorylase
MNTDLIVVLVSADTEWEALLSIFPEVGRSLTPYGEWFRMGRKKSNAQYLVIPQSLGEGTGVQWIFFHGGWGKIAAAGSTQYAIDRWNPGLIINSGAIAWVANRNLTPLLILRGVTDLVGSQGGEAYGNLPFYTQATKEIIQRLIASLPGWVTKFIGAARSSTSLY